MHDYGLNRPPREENNDKLDMPELVVPRSIDDVDLMGEVLEQLAHVKRLRDYIATDRNTPANQKAQVNNSCTQLIVQLTKTQTDLYSAERVKKMEGCLIKCLHALPDHVVSQFFDMYEAELKNVR